LIESFRRAPVPSCHSDAAGPVAASGAPVVALVGAPNVGKTTLFNTLTGARRETGNWPGTSVAVGHGSWQLPGREVAVVDLPGAYSLARSPRRGAHPSPAGRAEAAGRPVTVVVSTPRPWPAAYLLAQVREQPGRVIGVLTMNDVAVGQGLRVDADRLASAAGMPVVALDPRRRTGIDPLAGAVIDALAGPPLPARGDDAAAVVLPEPNEPTAQQ
jgi:ferrous iron transport protein B